LDELRDRDAKSRKQIIKLTDRLEAIEGKKKFDPSKAFQTARKENDISLATRRESTLTIPSQVPSMNGGGLACRESELPSFKFAVPSAKPSVQPPTLGRKNSQLSLVTPLKDLGMQ